MSDTTQTKTDVAAELKEAVENVLNHIDQEREREIITRRFGLFDRRETLEQIGELLGITRERVRQLEKAILVRLKIAADLLKNKSTTISEIAYSVGFNDIGYFSKSFKDLYGMTPSQFRESDKNQTPVDSTSS